jgi:hypothetical protein
LDETYEDLLEGTSFNDGRKFYFCIKDKVWVWDHEKSPFGLGANQNNLIWYFYDNVNAANWAYHKKTLYHGDRTKGNITEFKPFVLNDYGQPLDATWIGKYDGFDIPDYYKDLPEIRIETMGSTDSTMEVTLINDGNGEQWSNEIIEGQPVFDWDNNWDWDTFTWDSQKSPNLLVLYPNLQNIRYNQLKLRNNVLNEDLSLMTIITKYFVNEEVA